MLRFNLLSLIPLLLFVSCYHNTYKQPSDLKAKGYIVTSNGDEVSKRWAKYISYHLEKRANGNLIIELTENESLKSVPENFTLIDVKIDTNLRKDYCIEHKNNRLYLRMHDEKTALWMSYQLIESLTDEDVRFATNDIPPAIISFKDGCTNFDFSYREPYFLPNLEPEYAPIIGTNNLETDWALWGHNLSKVIKGAKDQQIYALVNGKRNKNQFSFSSKKLLQLTTDYIIDNFGDGTEHSYYFMIAPEDNNLACTCPDCTQLGNTDGNATPAVTDFINKLSMRFPKHQFFTIAYLTTNEAPKTALPSNVGVFLSSINLPKGVYLNENQPKTKQFLEILNAWKEKTSNIYVWDYGSNFDDYLTPLPILYGLQKQLKFFKNHQIKGVFLNGSGYDYSSFDDLKTFVSGALMMNVDTNVDSLCTRFFRKNYPKSHHLLANYYLSLEKSLEAKDKPYDIYGGTIGNIDTYLDIDEFVTFYNRVKEIIPEATISEKERLQELYTALSFTRLQIAYFQGANKFGYADNKESEMKVNFEIEPIISNLKNYVNYSNLSNYRETDGFLSDYLQNWDKIISQKSFQNLLIGTEIEILSEPDEGFQESNWLNDGTPGFSMDYHQGWYISSNNLDVGFSTGDINGKKNVTLRFLHNERHGFFAPEKVEIWGDGKLISTFGSKYYKRRNGEIQFSFPLDFSTIDKIEIKFYRKSLTKSLIACDEIQITN